jgi:hypothetical protein
MIQSAQQIQLPPGESRLIAERNLVEDTTTIGCGQQVVVVKGSINMEAQLTSSVAPIQTDGKPTKSVVRKQKPKLTQEDEFSILLTQINSCRDAGMSLPWIRLKPDNVVALLLPDVKMCENNHLHVGEKCNYCSPSPIS